MSAALNIQSLNRDQIGEITAHNFRLGPTPAHVDPARSDKNQTLYGDRTVPGALGPLPSRQPDTGRKIRPDARLVASLLCTLPKELDPADTYAWASRTLHWLQTDCPGQLAYAVLHNNPPKR